MGKNKFGQQRIKYLCPSKNPYICHFGLPNLFSEHILENAYYCGILRSIERLAAELEPVLVVYKATGWC